jgi:hypothetical protein
MINRIYSCFILLFYTVSFSQTNNATFSPYSLFGLGKFNDNNTGITNSLGRSGIAIGTTNEINGLNPASLASMNRNSFFLDIGVKGEYNLYGDRSETDTKPTLFNFSNFTFALPIGKKSGVSVSLIPYTEVGYFFEGIINDIEGTQTKYTSNIVGSGGLNNFNFNYGRKLNSKMNVGISAKYYFGSIKQNEIVNLDQDLLTIVDENYYTGFKFEIGMQYQATEKLNFSSVLNFPSRLKGVRDREITKISSEIPTIIEAVEGANTNNYRTPLDFTIGLKYDFKEFYFIADHKKMFWSATNLEDGIGKYTDSNMYGFGIEYFRKKRQGQGGKTRYRIGFNYDDGNLKVRNKKISTSLFTTGIGIPLGNVYNSYLNFSYSYGSKGYVSSTLVKENYHSLSVNFCFEDLWFRKRLID